MKIDKKTMIAWASAAALASAAVMALLTVFSVIGLILAVSVTLWDIILTILEILLSAAQVAFSIILFKKGEGKLFIILLIVLFSVSFIFSILNFIVGNVSFWTISQFLLCLTAIALLSASLIVKE